MSQHLSEPIIDFPAPHLALQDPNGLLAMGGDLSPKRLMKAYHSGIFPWFSEDEPILWWSPDPRAVLYPDLMHVSKSLRKFIKHCDYKISINHAFKTVIENCALLRDETWITTDIIKAYHTLHQLGFAHSIEVWQNDDLIGGLYGVALGHVFCGESMFSRQTNASKIALYAFCQHFMSCGGQLIDCQVLNPHTASLGVIEIPRHDYLTQLRQLKENTLARRCWQKQFISY